MRKLSDLTGGAHADPVDQADAILWVENLRIRALALCDQQDSWMTRGEQHITWPEAAHWMSQAWELLSEVARG